MRVRNLAIAFLACAASYLGAQQVNPTTGINWPAATGASAPVAGCPTATTGNTANGSKTVLVASGGGVLVNQAVTGTGITAGTTVAAIFGTKVTLSANATATGTGVALNFYPLGRPYTVQSTGGLVCLLPLWLGGHGRLWDLRHFVWRRHQHQHRWCHHCGRAQWHVAWRSRHRTVEDHSYHRRAEHRRVGGRDRAVQRFLLFFHLP